MQGIGKVQSLLMKAYCIVDSFPPFNGDMGHTQ